jgi:hypothetical protein
MLTILVDSPDRVKRRMKETHSNGDKEEVYDVASRNWELPPSIVHNRLGLFMNYILFANPIQRSMKKKLIEICR